MMELYYRTYQFVAKRIMARLPWREPLVVKGKDSLIELPRMIAAANLDSILVVTDEGLSKSGLLDDFLHQMEMMGIRMHIYDDVHSNPTIRDAESAASLYKDMNCQGIMAFGGGSPIDCAKVAAVRVTKPHQPISNMRGIFKIRKNMPPFFVVPTTAGTGTETTLAAVITNSDTHEKYALMDLSLIPHVAILDPVLTIGLPKKVTAMTGMDTLTHAVEAYIGYGGTAETDKNARKAVQLVFNNLYQAYNDGSDIEARSNMQEAAYKAGFAFTRAFVGNIHAVAHTLGGFYNVPHGLANAVIMPYVLEYYSELDVATYQLAELADIVNITQSGDDDEEKARKFILAIRELNASMGIPKKIAGIKDADIPHMIDNAHREANPLYPVPAIFGRADFEKIYREIKE
ncbi:iron-containing alcohol dehydrogenase [Salinicoccus siamensis]|uniref:Iron-containing alcohol dehydrogenase n=1 Tax=Salinicoccus siamensis TaxID=381830 RepID=A0ABV5Z485_9STAP